MIRFQLKQLHMKAFYIFETENIKIVKNYIIFLYLYNFTYNYYNNMGINKTFSGIIPVS